MFSCIKRSKSITDYDDPMIVVFLVLMSMFVIATSASNLAYKVKADRVLRFMCVVGAEQPSELQDGEGAAEEIERQS